MEEDIDGMAQIILRQITTKIKQYKTRLGQIRLDKLERLDGLDGLDRLDGCMDGQMARQIDRQID